jgi:hypothetical protein
MGDEYGNCGCEPEFGEEAGGETQGAGERGDLGPVLVDSTKLE